MQNNFTVTGWAVVTPDYANFPTSQEMIVIATPEPGTLLLLVAGAFGGLIVVFRRIA